MITCLQSHLLCDPQERKDEIASVETVNNGKSIFEARWDVDTSWQCLEYYAGLAASMAGKALAWPSATCWQGGRGQGLVAKGKDFGVTALGLSLSAWVAPGMASSFLTLRS